MEKDRDLLEYLKARKFMALATYDREPWICSLYYLVDDDLNLYFISPPTTRHCQNIAVNNKVACAIADSNQEVSDKKAGVQLRGRAEIISGIKQINWFFGMWARVNPGNKETVNAKNYLDRIFTSEVYMITPQEIKFFNEALYPEEKFKIFS